MLTGKPPKQKAAREPEPDRKSGTERRKDAAERRRELAPLAKRIKDAESEMAKLQKAIRAVDAGLADPGLYVSDPARVAKLGKDRAEAERRLVRIEENWLALSAEYEAALAD